jgi:hypothetical protein
MQSMQVGKGAGRGGALTAAVPTVGRVRVGTARIARLCPPTHDSNRLKLALARNPRRYVNGTLATWSRKALRAAMAAYQRSKLDSDGRSGMSAQKR